jgi:hypothetical protein
MMSPMKRIAIKPLLLACVALTFAAFTTRADDAPPAAVGAEGLHLAEAVMCEGIVNFKPLHRSAVFAVAAGSITCFTAFDVVPDTVEVYHDWIKRDTVVYRKKLVLKPPNWSSISSIKLREDDKGPWRVEIRDPEGRLMALLRFSVTE